MWQRSLNLHESDRELVRTGQLNDRIIDAVNRLISQQIGVTNQTTLLVQASTGFDAAGVDAIMILHAPGHWVTVMANADEVYYVDSLRPHQQITAYIIKQLLQLFATCLDEEGRLTMSIVPSTPQSNGNDCGVYAAAYASELACGSGLRGLQTPYDVAAMRPHLEKCLEQGAMMPFPSDDKRAHGKRRKVVRVVVDVDGVNVIFDCDQHCIPHVIFIYRRVCACNYDVLELCVHFFRHNEFSN